MHRLIPALAAMWLAGCGYIGNVQPPLANVPSAVASLAVAQRGGEIIVEFPVPTLTTEGLPSEPPLTLDLRIGPGGVPFQVDEWAASAARITGARIDNGIARFQTPAAPWTGKEVVAAVRVVGANGKESDWSRYAIINVVPPPETPHDLTPAAIPSGVRLTWSARADLFRIYRKAAAAAEFVPIGEADKDEWTDTQVDFGQRYTYRVQSIAKLPNGNEAQSAMSAEVAITPQDVFPPAAPQGLRASAAPDSIELLWDANAEPFVAGYRVYRSAGAAFEKLADVGLVPSYSDRAAEHGKTYRYRITAISRSGTESQPSQTAEASLP